MTPPPIRILCAEDHRIVREGIELIINREPDMQVIASAATGEESIEMFRLHRPDVTLMDLQLGVMSGVEAMRAIRVHEPLARIVILTMLHGDEDIYRALEAGAAAYLLKDTLSDDLINVIRDVHAGRQPGAGPDLKAILAERVGRPTVTPREVQVLELIAAGLQNREIAAALGISTGTVQIHVKNILAKLDVKDRTSAANVAQRRGIVHIR